NISKSDMRNYMLSSIDFYLKRNEIKEVSRIYTLAKSKGVLTPEMRKKIGDLYYDNQHYEEALHIYHGLLTANPGQREVGKRIAAYHILMGDRAAKKENLEDAREAYKMAVQADAFEEEGSRKLISMDIIIEKRDFRNMTQGDLNALAQKLVSDADGAARERDYAGAIQYLQEAKIAYANVTDEFPALSKQKTMGMHTVKMKSKEMKEALVKNAQRLSGSGFAFDAKRLAGMTENTAPTALQTVIKSEYESAVSDIAKDITTP
ncbi:MAG: tetratricopeptide repeat protein, partial [Flavobacteriales bacterium]